MSGISAYISVAQHDEILAALERGSRSDTEAAVRNHVTSLLEYRAVEETDATRVAGGDGRIAAPEATSADAADALGCPSSKSA